MKLQTHFMIAKIASENAGFSKPKQMIFCIGALIPDLSLMQFIHPHFYNRSGEYIMRKINKLSGCKSVYAILELGKAAHYISDFCCSAHFGGGIGNVFEHILYERNLNLYAAENYVKLKNESLPFNSALSAESILEKYFQEEKFDFYTDIIAAVRACFAICELVHEKGQLVGKKVLHPEIG